MLSDFNEWYHVNILLDEKSPMAVVPENLDLVPIGALYLQAATAWSALVTNGHIKAGQKVLIHGGAGGVGSMAIQIAKDAGAYVITTAKGIHK